MCLEKWLQLSANTDLEYFLSEICTSFLCVEVINFAFWGQKGLRFKAFKIDLGGD